jgi:hypothetical protein
MRRLMPAFVLSAALLAAGGCTDPYGRVDYGRTALLGVGVGGAAALAAGALSDRPRPYYGGRRGHYGGGGYGYVPRRGYDYDGYGRRGGYYGGW